MKAYVHSRRRFLRQSFSFSALAALGLLPGIAAPLLSDPAAAELLMVGDWDTTTTTPLSPA
jgi:tartrate-resistant acid phosphatase type 5